MKKDILNAGGIEISNSKCEKLLGIKIDCKLMFDNHVKSLCKKASQKLNSLSRVAYQLDFNQRKLLLNAFIRSFIYSISCLVKKFMNYDRACKFFYKKTLKKAKCL